MTHKQERDSTAALLASTAEQLRVAEERLWEMSVKGEGDMLLPPALLKAALAEAREARKGGGRRQLFGSTPTQSPPFVLPRAAGVGGGPVSFAPSTPARPARPISARATQSPRRGGGVNTVVDARGTRPSLVAGSRADALVLARQLDAELDAHGELLSVFDGALDALVQQVGAHCAERGALLNRVRTWLLRHIWWLERQWEQSREEIRGETQRANEMEERARLAEARMAAAAPGGGGGGGARGASWRRAPMFLSHERRSNSSLNASAVESQRGSKNAGRAASKAVGRPGSKAGGQAQALSHPELLQHFGDMERNEAVEALCGVVEDLTDLEEEEDKQLRSDVAEELLRNMNDDEQVMRRLQRRASSVLPLLPSSLLPAPCSLLQVMRLLQRCASSRGPERQGAVMRALMELLSSDKVQAASVIKDCLQQWGNDEIVRLIQSLHGSMDVSKRAEIWETIGPSLTDDEKITLRPAVMSVERCDVGSQTEEAAVGWAKVLREFTELGPGQRLKMLEMLTMQEKWSEAEKRHFALLLGVPAPGAEGGREGGGEGGKEDGLGEPREGAEGGDLGAPSLKGKMRKASTVPHVGRLSTLGRKSTAGAEGFAGDGKGTLHAEEMLLRVIGELWAKKIAEDTKADHAKKASPSASRSHRRAHRRAHCRAHRRAHRRAYRPHAH